MASTGPRENDMEPDGADECDRPLCRQIAETASDVYCEITGGLLSYPTYEAWTILAHYADDVQKQIDEAVAEAVAAVLGEVADRIEALPHRSELSRWARSDYNEGLTEAARLVRDYAAGVTQR